MKIVHQKECSVSTIQVDPSRTIDSLAIDGTNLYALVNGGYSSHGVYKYTIGDSLSLVTGLDVTGHPTFGSMYMKVGGGNIYIGAADNNNSQQIPGIEIIQDLGSSLNLVGAPSAITAFDLALNGSGLAVYLGAAAASPFSSGEKLGVLNVTDPTKTGQLVTTIDLGGGEPWAVQIASGLAFIADGSAGLKIVNYRSFDTKGVAPTISNIQGPVDTDPNTSGIQVIEGSTVSLSATITDDVQVRNVQLLVNGQVVSNNVSYPWDLSVVMPSIAANGSNQVTLQIRATDTGGNVTTSAPITVQLVKDTTPPVLVNTNLQENDVRGQSYQSFIFTFNKPLGPTTVNASTFALIGPDGKSVTPVSVELRSNGKTVEVTYNSLALGQFKFEMDTGHIMDTVGNTMGTSIVTTDFTVKAYSDVWTNPNGGDWNDAANWSNGKVPGVNDSVYIYLNPTAQITINQAVSISSLVESGGGTIVINNDGYNSNGSLSISHNAQIADNLTINGGTYYDTGSLSIGGTLNWIGGTITGGGILTLNGSSSVTGFNTLDGMVLNGVLNIGSDSYLIIKDGLIVSSKNGITPAINFTSYWAILETTTTETLDNLTLNLNQYGAELKVASGTTLTLGKNLIINSPSSASYIGIYGNGSLINHGTINNTTGTLNISATAFSNQGTLLTSSGTTIISSSFNNQGTFNITGGSLELSGNYNTSDLLANLGNVLISNGGALAFSGTLDNSNATLNVGAGQAITAFTLSGGTIIGGTVQTDVNSFNVINNSTLDGVVLNGVLNMGRGPGFFASTELIIKDGLSGSNANGITPTINNIISATIDAPTTETIDNLTINFNNWYDYLQVDSGAILTLGKNIVLNTSSSNNNLSGTGSLVNQGTINTTGGALSINTTSFSNQGTVTTSGGTTILGNSFNNQGTFNINGGTLALSGNYKTSDLANLGKVLTSA